MGCKVLQGTAPSSLGKVLAQWRTGIKLFLNFVSWCTCPHHKIVVAMEVNEHSRAAHISHAFAHCFLLLLVDLSQTLI